MHERTAVRETTGRERETRREAIIEGIMEVNSEIWG